MSDTALETTNAPRERTDGNGYWFELLLEANGWAVTVGLALAIFTVL